MYRIVHSIIHAAVEYFLRNGERDHIDCVGRNDWAGEAHDYGRIDVQVSRQEAGGYGSTGIALWEHWGMYVEGVASTLVSQVFWLDSSMPCCVCAR